MEILTVENILLSLASLQLIYIVGKTINNIFNKPKTLINLTNTDSISIINTFISITNQKINIQLDKSVESSFIEDNTIFINSQKAYIKLLPEIICTTTLLLNQKNWAVKNSTIINTMQQAVWIIFAVTIIFVLHPDFGAYILLMQISLLVLQNFLSYLPTIQRWELANNTISYLLELGFLHPAEVKTARKYLQFWIWNNNFYKYNFQSNQFFGE